MATLQTKTEPMVINMGPHHPSMHGVLRLIVTLDGENVIDCEPVIGYLHRGMEKIAESRTNVMFVPYVSRWDYAAGMFNEAITVNAPEQLADIPVPRRASYIRMIMLELNRIANHLLWLGPFMADCGATTPFFYIFRERELIYDLWEAASGARLINNNYFRVGGVAADLPYGWIDKCEDFCDYFMPKVDEYEKLITDNPIFRRRVEGVGTMSREDAINWGCSGPMLRASGVKWTTTNATTNLIGTCSGPPKVTALPAISSASMKCASPSKSSARPCDSSPAAPLKTWKPSEWQAVQSLNGTTLTISLLAKKSPLHSKSQKASTIHHWRRQRLPLALENSRC